MEKVSVLSIRDKDEDQEALAIVRSVNGFVSLTLSLEHDGDIQVTFTPSECAELVLRLQQAIFDAQGETLISGPLAAPTPMPNPAAPKIGRLVNNGKFKNG